MGSVLRDAARGLAATILTVLVAFVATPPLRVPIVRWTRHAAWDARHHAGRQGDWVPRHYPMFCLTYDLGLAVFAAWLAVGGSA